jgi:hypothetical protein
MNCTRHSTLSAWTLLPLGAIAVLAAILAFLGGCATPEVKAGSPDTAAAPVPAPASAAVAVPIPPDALATPEEHWGIQVSGIRLSAAGYMLDFRYRVLDAGKAAPVLSRRVKPYLVVDANGAKLNVPNTPKLGLLRQVASGANPDRTHFMLFANPGQMVQAGSKVTLVMGDMKVENIVVQ